MNSKPQTCCCHVCKTSLNQYKREFLPCTKCNKIVCRNCFGTKYKGHTWESAFSIREKFLCPSCQGICPCPRCRKKQSKNVSNASDSMLINGYFKNQDTNHSDNSENEKDLSSLKRKKRNINEENNQYIENDILQEEKKLKSTKNNQFSSSLNNSIKSEKFLKIHQVVLEQLNELIEREKRCDNNIKEMEKLLAIMKKEKEKMFSERQKMEKLLEKPDKNIVIDCNDLN